MSRVNKFAWQSEDDIEMLPKKKPAAKPAAKPTKKAPKR